MTTPGCLHHSVTCNPAPLPPPSSLSLKGKGKMPWGFCSHHTDPPHWPSAECYMQRAANRCYPDVNCQSALHPLYLQSSSPPNFQVLCSKLKPASGLWNRHSSLVFLAFASQLPPNGVWVGFPVLSVYAVLRRNPLLPPSPHQLFLWFPPRLSPKE